MSQDRWDIPNGFWWIDTTDFPDFNMFSTQKNKSQSQWLWLCLSNWCSCYRLKVKIIEDIAWQTIASISRVASKIYDWYAPCLTYPALGTFGTELTWNNLTHPRSHILIQSLQAPTNGSWIHGCHAYGTPQPRCCDREIIIVSTDVVSGWSQSPRNFIEAWSLLCKKLWVLKVCPILVTFVMICVVPFFVAGASTWRLGVQAPSPGSDR